MICVGPLSGRARIARDAQADRGADAGFSPGAAVGSTTQDMPVPSQKPMSLSRSSLQDVSWEPSALKLSVSMPFQMSREPERRSCQTERKALSPR
jgi:hypothetical protein